MSVTNKWNVKFSLHQDILNHGAIDMLTIFYLFKCSYWSQTAFLDMLPMNYSQEKIKYPCASI